MIFENNIDFALNLDLRDSLKDYRDLFYIPKDKSGNEVIYFAGNSLGLQPKSVRDYVEQELNDWQELGVEGHMNAKNPWLPYHEFLTQSTARLVGAKEDEVVNMNGLTVNLHLLFISFYKPDSKRNKILIEANAFPSDYYAVESQIKFHGFEPEKCLIEMKPRSGESIIRTEDIIETINKVGESIAVVWLSGVNYYTGQAFEIEKITKAAHEAGCYAGFDLAHAAGNLVMNLHAWNVDFAVWCSYKYLNGGPGATGGAYVYEKHLKDKNLPKLLGWWGQDKATRFLMEHKFVPIPTVESWQLSNPPILQLAALKASLDIFEKAGIEKLRQKSEMLTGYMEYLINENSGGRIEIISPREIEQRGCQLSLRAKENGKELLKKLNENNIICDWREPDVIRVAPVPFYNTFEDVYRFAEIIKKT